MFCYSKLAGVEKNINIDPLAENIIKLHICSSEPNWKGRVLNIKKFLNSLH